MDFELNGMEPNLSQMEAQKCTRETSQMITQNVSRRVRPIPRLERFNMEQVYIFLCVPKKLILARILLVHFFLQHMEVYYALT